MAAPTIESRLQRRFVIMSSDPQFVARARGAAPPGWEAQETLEVAALGGFEDVLQYRFLLLDLDEPGALDPLEAVTELRRELMLNIPIFCFGGSMELRDAARLARADRFFERSEVEARVGQFCNQFGWGG